MMVINDIEPDYSLQMVRISASRGRGGYNMTTYIRDRCHDAENKSVRVCSSVNRDLDCISYRGPHSDRPFHQVIELGQWQFTNTITSVSKDNILWIEREI